MLVTRKSGGRDGQSENVKNKISVRGRVTEGSRDERQKENICGLRQSRQGGRTRASLCFLLSLCQHGFDRRSFFLLIFTDPDD